MALQNLLLFYQLPQLSTIDSTPSRSRINDQKQCVGNIQGRYPGIKKGKRIHLVIEIFD